jgi:hypothetical protein
MIKRNLGSCLSGRAHSSKIHEMRLKGLAHNIAIGSRSPPDVIGSLNHAGRLGLLVQPLALIESWSMVATAGAWMDAYAKDSKEKDYQSIRRLAALDGPAG